MTRSRMSPRQWRFFVAAIAIAFGILDLWGLAQWQRALVPGVGGTLGVQLFPSGGIERKVFSVSADSPLDRAGVKAGDFIRFEHRADRTRLLAAGEAIPLDV